MDLHRLRVVGFDTLANAEKGRNKNIAEHEESRKEDNVIDDDNKYYETNELDDATDTKCTQENMVSSGSSKNSNFMNRKSKSEIFRIPSRIKLQNRDLKVNSSFEDLPKQLKHLNKKKKTLKLFNRRSTADQGDLRKTLETSKYHEDVRFLFTRETPSFIRYSRKRAKCDWPKIGYDQKYSNDLYGFKKTNRYFDPYLYQMSCNYLNIDKFPLKKLRKGFRRKAKAKSQPSKDCSCKHHAMRVLNSAVKSSERGDNPSIYYNLSKVHSHVRRNRHKRDVSFHQNEGWARDPSYYAIHKDQNVAVSPSSLAPLKRCCCDACVGSSKVEITSRPNRRPPVVYRDATSSHHKPPGKYRPKPNPNQSPKQSPKQTPKQSPESQHMPSSQDSSLSHNKLILEHTPGTSSPKNANHLYKPQFVVCKSRKNKKKTRKSSFLNNQRKTIFRGIFQKIAAFHTKSKISGKNCIKYVFFGLLIVVWSPCLLAVILAWVVMCPVRLTNMLADDKSRKTFAFWKSFMHRFRKKDPGSDYGRMCCDHCSRQNHKSFLSSVASWYARAAGTVITSFNALISMLKIKKARSCGSSFMTSTHPNPRKRYTLYYADNRGWMMKPTRRSKYNRPNTRVVQSMRCEFRPKFWPKSKRNPDAQMEMETACTNIPVQCPVHGDKCAKVKALRRKILSPAGDAGQMLSESSPSCVCDAFLKRSKTKQRSAMLMPETSPRYDPGQKVNIPSTKFYPSYGKASTSLNYQTMNTNPIQLNLSKQNELVKNFYPKCQSQWKSGTLPLGVVFDCPCGTKHPIISNREVNRTHMFGLAGKTLNFCAKHSSSYKSKGSREESYKPRIALNCPCGKKKNDKQNVGNRKTYEIPKSKQIKMQSKDIQSKQKRLQSQSTPKRIALNCPCGDELNMTVKKSRVTRVTNLGNKVQKNTLLNKHDHQIRTRNKGISVELSQSALTRQAKTSTIEIIKTDKSQSISQQTLRQKLKYLVDRNQGTSNHSLKQKKKELIDRSQNVSNDNIFKKKPDLIDRSQNVSKDSIYKKKPDLVDCAQNISKHSIFLKNPELIDKSQNVSKHSFGQQKTELIDKTQNASKTSIDQKNINLIDRSQNVSKHSFSQNKKDLIDRSQNISKDALNVDQVNASGGSAKGATVECGCWTGSESRPSDEKRMTQTSLIDRLLKSKSIISQKLSINKASRDDCPCVSITQQTEEIRPDPLVPKSAVDCACRPEIQPSSTAAKTITLNLAQGPKEQTEKAAQCACDNKLTKNNKKTDQKSLIVKNGIDCECNTEINKKVTSSETQSLTPFCPCPVPTHRETAINREKIKSCKQQALDSEKHLQSTDKADKCFYKPSTIQKEKQSVPYKLAIDCGCETDKQLITATDLQPRVTNLKHVPKHEAAAGSNQKESVSKKAVDCSCKTEAQSSTIKTENKKPTQLGVKCTCRESVLAEKSKSIKGSVICECWPETKQSETQKETTAKQVKLSKEKVDCSCETEAQSSTIKTEKDKRTLLGVKCTCRESVLAEKSKSNKGSVICECWPETKQSATQKETTDKQVKLSKEKVDCSCETEVQSSAIKTEKDKRTVLGVKCTCSESVPDAKSKSNKGSVTCECFPEKKQSALQKETVPAKQVELSKEKVDCSCETEVQSGIIKKEKDKRTVLGVKCTCSESVPNAKSKSNKGSVTCGCIPEKKQSATQKEKNAEQVKLSKEKVECGCGTDKQTSVTFRDTVPEEQVKTSKLMIDCGCGTDDQPNAPVDKTQQTLLKGSDLSSPQLSQTISFKAPSKIDIALNCPCGSSHKQISNYKHLTTISKKSSISSSHLSQNTVSVKQDPRYKKVINCPCPVSPEPSTHDRETLTSNETILVKKPSKQRMASQLTSSDKASEAGRQVASVSLSVKTVDCACGPDPSVGDKKSPDGLRVISQQQNKHSKLSQKDRYGLAADCACGENNTDVGSLNTQKPVLKSKIENKVMDVRHSQMVNNLRSANFPYGVAQNCKCAKKKLTQYKTDSRKKIQSETRKQEISPHTLLSKEDSSQRHNQKSLADKDKRSTQVKPLTKQKHPSSVQVAKTPHKQSKLDENQNLADDRKKTYENNLTPHPSSKVIKDSQSQNLQKQSLIYGKALDCSCDSIEELSSKPPRTSSVGVVPEKQLTISNKNKSTEISSTKIPTKNLKSTETPRITLQKQAPEYQMASDCECVSDAEDEKLKETSRTDKKRSSADQKSSAVIGPPLKSKSSEVGITQCECSSDMVIQERKPQTHQSIKNETKSLRGLSTASAENPTTSPQLLESQLPVTGVSPDCTCSKKLKMNKSSLKVPFPFESQKASQTRPTQMSKKRSDLQRNIAKTSTLKEEPKQATLLKYPRKTSLTKISSNQQNKISHIPRDTSQMFNKLKESFIKMSKKQTLAKRVPGDLPDTLKSNGHLPPKPSLNRQPSSRKVKETQTKPLWLGRPCFCSTKSSRSASHQKRTIHDISKTKKQLSKRDTEKSQSHQSEKSKSYQSEKSKSYQPEKSKSYQIEKSKSYQSEKSKSYQPEKSKSYQSEKSKSYQPEKSKSYQSEKSKSYQSEKSNPYQSERSQPEMSKVSSVKSSRSNCLEKRLDFLRRRISSLQRLPHCSCGNITNRSSSARKPRPFCCCSINDKTNKKKIFYPVVTSRHRISQRSLNHTECVCPASDCKVPAVTRSHLFNSLVVNKSQTDKGQLQIPKQKLSISHSSQNMLLCPDQAMPNSPKHDKKKLKRDKIKKKSQKSFETKYKSTKEPCLHTECACSSVELPFSAHFPPSSSTHASSRLSRLVMKFHCKLFSRKKCPQTNIPQTATRVLSPGTRCSVSRHSKISHLSPIPVSVQQTSSHHTRKSTLEDKSQVSFKRNSQMLRKSSLPSFSLNSNSRLRCSVHKDFSKYPSGSTTRHIDEPSKLDKPCTCPIEDGISQQSRQSMVSYVSCSKCFSHEVPSLQLSSIKTSNQTPKSLVGQYYPRLSQRSINQRSKTSHSSTVLPLTPMKCNCSHDEISCAQHDNIPNHVLKTSSAKKSHSKSSKRDPSKLDKISHRPSCSHQTKSNPYTDLVRGLPQNSQKLSVSRGQQTTKTPNLSSTDKSQRLPTTREKHQLLDSITHAHLSKRTNQTSRDTSLSQDTKSKAFSEKFKHFSDKLSRRSHKNEKSSPLIPGGCHCDEISKKVSQFSHINEKNIKSPPLIPGECYCEHISEKLSKLSYKSAPYTERQYISSRQGSHCPCNVCLENEGKNGVFHHIASQQTKVSEPSLSKLSVATSFSAFAQSQNQLYEKVNNPDVSQQLYERNKHENIDPQKQILHYSNNQPVQRYPLHPFIPIPILPGKCTCAENQHFKSENTQNMKEEFLNQQINSVPMPSVHRPPESQSAEKLRLLSEKLLPHHKATMKTEEPPTPSEYNQPSELIRHFPQNSTLDTSEQRDYSKQLSIRKSSHLPSRTTVKNEYQPPTRKSTSQNQPVIKEPSKSKQQLLELEPDPAIAIIPGVCKCSRNQSEYSKLQQNLQHIPSQQTKMTEITPSMHSFHPINTESKQRLSDQVSVNSPKNVEPVEPYNSLSQKPKISSNTPHVSSSPIQSADKQRLSSDLESPFQQKSSIADNEEQHKISQNHQSEQTKIPLKSSPIQQIQPRRIIPGKCTCSISKDRIRPAIVQNQLQKSASESKFPPQILNHHLSQQRIIPQQPSHIHRIEQPQSFAKKNRNSCKIGVTENMHPSRCQHITIQRSEVIHNKPGSLRFKLPVICPNVNDDRCTGNSKCELVTSPNKMSRHVLSSTTPVDKPPGLLQQHSTGQVHPVRKRSTDSGKQQKYAQPANAQQFPVGPPNMPPPQPDFNRVAMRYPGHNPKPEHIPSPANYYYPPPAAGVPPPNYARLPCFINPLNNCGPKSSGDEQSLRRAYKRRPIRFTPPKQQEKIPKTKATKALKKKAEVKKKPKKKKGGGGKISQFFDCVRELVFEADKEAWPVAVSCRPLYIHAMRRRPCFWVYECCPSLYPMFLSFYKFQENICQMFMYVLSICFWCPLIVCIYFCCDLMCGNSN